MLLPYEYINATGTIIPDYSVILQQVTQEWLDEFGSDLITDPSTPQGVLINAEAIARYAVAVNNSELANQINPNLAGGIFLDAICALTGLYRAAAIFSTVIVNLNGVNGTIIPTSVTVSNANGDLFQLTASVTIGPSTMVQGLFRAVVDGPIAAAPGTITTIVNGVVGLETVTNPMAATIGQEQQSDLSLRTLRKLSLFRNAQSVSGAVLSALFALVDSNGNRIVKSASYRDNVANTTQVIDGVTLVAHSIYVCVDVNSIYYQNVADSIYSKKSAGSNYNNGASASPHSVAVTDPFSGQVSNVLFDTPDQIDILIRVTISQGTSTADLQVVVKDAITKYAAGEVEGFTGFIIGNSVSCFEISGAILAQVPGVFIHNVETSLISPVSYSNAEIPISIFEVAFTQNSAITVVVV